MAWDEIKQSVNSYLDVPLNHIIWLNEYKTYGEDSYVFRDKDILNELYLSKCALNDTYIYQNALSYIVQICPDKFAESVSHIYTVRENGWDKILKPLTTMESIICNSAVASNMSQELIDFLFTLNVFADYVANLSDFESTYGGKVETITDIPLLEDSSYGGLQMPLKVIRPYAQNTINMVARYQTTGVSHVDMSGETVVDYVEKSNNTTPSATFEYWPTTAEITVLNRKLIKGISFKALSSVSTTGNLVGQFTGSIRRIMYN